MKVIATLSFAGVVTMYKGECKDIPEDTAADLIKCGYVEAVDNTPPANATPPKDNTPPADNTSAKSPKKAPNKNSKSK